jgi:hypothetical protein
VNMEDLSSTYGDRASPKYCAPITRPNSIIRQEGIYYRRIQKNLSNFLAEEIYPRMSTERKMERIKEGDLAKNGNGENDDSEEELINNSNPRKKTSWTERDAEIICLGQLMDDSQALVEADNRRIWAKHTKKSPSQ